MSGRTRPGTTTTLWVGWIAFAAVMISLSGLFNAISGLAAVFSDDLFTVTPRGVLVLDVTGWGWVHLVLGVGLLATGVGTLLGSMVARMAALVLVALNMVSQLLLMPAYPFWSIVVIAMDILVIWAITVHGEEIESL